MSTENYGLAVVCFQVYYAAVSGKHTKIYPEPPIAEVFIYESDYDDEYQYSGNA